MDVSKGLGMSLWGRMAWVGVPSVSGSRAALVRSITNVQSAGVGLFAWLLKNACDLCSKLERRSIVHHPQTR